MPLWDDCRTGARDDGLVPAFALLTRALSPTAPPRGPGGHALVARTPGGGDGTEPGAGTAAGSTGAEALPGGGELVALPPVPEDGRTDGRTDGDARVGESDAWRTALAWLRLGASEGLRDATVAHLGERSADGEALLLKQMVKGALAEVLMEHLEIAEVLERLAAPEAVAPDSPLAPRHSGDGGAALTESQDRITRADRALLRLLGAYGFTTEGPGAAAYDSELLADVYGTRNGTGARPEEDQ